MNRTISGFAAAAAVLALAAPASSHENGPVLIIRHQMRGCHAWSLGLTGAAKVSQTVWLKRGVHLEVGNNDVMPHKLMQLRGPRRLARRYEHEQPRRDDRGQVPESRRLPVRNESR